MQLCRLLQAMYYRLQLGKTLYRVPLHLPNLVGIPSYLYSGPLFYDIVLVNLKSNEQNLH